MWGVGIIVWGSVWVVIDDGEIGVGVGMRGS